VRYRPLGRTGWMVSEIGLGTYPLGGALQTSGSYWSGPATYGAVARDTAVETIHAGLARGLSFVDTAPVYGEAEVFVGEALRAGPTSQPCYVATKCGEHVRPVAGGGPPVLARDFSRAALRESIARSQRRLAVQRLDLMMLHSPRPDEEAEDPVGLLAELQGQGQIAHVGVSARSVDHAVQLIEQDGRAEVIQVSFNLLQPKARRRLFPLSAERGVGLVVRTPLASGFLTGTIAEDHVFAPDDYRSTMPREQIARLALQARAFAWLVDEGIATSLPDAALRYVLSFPAVSTVIAGAMRPSELLANLSVSDAGPLPPSALERIEALQTDMGLN
jgi:aryl-alcohol dehydrogenase-like predicted oxidoreductase